MKSSMASWPKVSILVGVLLCVGIFFRLFNFSAVPYSLYWDEAAILLDAKVLAATGHDIHGNSGWQLIFPSYGDYKLPVYIWLSTAAVKVFGVTNLAVRFPSLLAGFATMLAVWVLAKGLGVTFQAKSEKVWAWASLVVIAISPWAIGFSRTGFESHVAQAFMVWSLVVWVQKVINSNRKMSSLFFWLWVLLSAVLGVAAAYTYFALRFVWPVVLIASLVLVKDWKTDWKRIVAATVVAIVVGYVGFIPMTSSPLYGASNSLRLGTASLLNTDTYVLESNVMREIAGNTVFERLFFHRSLLMGQGLLKNYADHFSWQYLFMSGDPNLRHSTGAFGLFLLPFVVLPFVGLARFKGKFWRVVTWLMVWWLAAVLPAAIPMNTPHALRSLSGVVPASLALGGCLTLAYHWSQTLSRKHVVQWGLIGVWCIWLTLSLFAYGRYYFTVYPKVSAKDWQHGYAEVAQAVQHNYQTYNHPVIVASFDDRFFLWQLALPEYAPEDIPQMKHNQYRIVATGQDAISFEEIPQMKEWAIAKRSFAVAGTPGQIETWQKMLNVSFTTTEKITSPTGEVLYQVANATYDTQ